MRKAAFWLILGLFLLGSVIIGQNFSYVGSGKCKMCHQTESRGNQYSFWQQSKHAQSFSVLTSEKAAERAQAADVSTPTEAPQCLKCHAPLADKAPELKDEGVTCEVCHGPGSAYRKFSIMKDRAKAIENGLKLYGSPEAIKTYCLRCHENAHHQPFNFAAAWQKIKHPLPQK